MFDKKQVQNIRNALFKYVSNPSMRSRIVMLAESLAEDEATDAEKTQVYWSTIWFCSQPKNHDEFEKMFREMAAAGQIAFNQEIESAGVIEQAKKRRTRTGDEKAK